jgi:hypothetical protein
MNGKRAQSSLEYLLTYGWALILIAAVIGMLVFIISSPGGDAIFSSSDPDKILLKAGSMTSNLATVKLQNITGGNMEITSATGGCLVEGLTPSLPSPVLVTAGGQFTLECTAPNNTLADVIIQYTDFASLQRQVIISATQGTPTVILLNDGFEDGTFNAWTTTQPNPPGVRVTASTDQANSGSYSVKFDRGVAGDTARLDKQTSTMNEGYTRFYIRFESFCQGPANNNCRILDITQTVGPWDSPLMLWQEESGGNYYFLVSDFVWPGRTTLSSVPLSLDTWYKVEIWYLRDAVNGAKKVWINGNLKLDHTNFNTGNNDPDYWAFGDSGLDPDAANVVFYIDDIVINQTRTG